MLDSSVPLFLQKYIGRPDPRIRNWHLTNTPKWFLTTWFLYVCFILFGQKYMSTRKAVNLKKLLVIYNAFQVYFSYYILKEVMSSAINMNYSVFCQPLNLSFHGESLRMVTAFWYFYFSKFIDLLDTVFLVLKKKKLTVLHLYHHSTMLFNWYVGVLYCPGGQAFISVVANCFVHVIMYTYYLLASMGPHMQKYLWWKKYLTQMQLAQFFLIVAHLSFGLFIKCNQPKFLAIFTITYMFTLILLFLNFYYKSYNMSKKRDRKQRIIYTLCSDSMNYLQRNRDTNAGGDKKTN